MDYLSREYEKDLDLDFITNYHNNYENNKYFYTETIDTISIFALYIDKANEVIDIKRDKFKEFLNSGNTYPKYKKEIARYKKQIDQLNKKHNYILKKIDKLKKI